MTDDASPENLRKFLESDDPAMVLMGLSMAKGAGVEVTIKDLERFLKSDDDETIKMGFTFAEEAGVGDEAIELLCERLADDDYEGRFYAAKALGEIGDARAVEPIMDALREHYLEDVKEIEIGLTGLNLAEEAGVGDEAIELLCERLADDDYGEGVRYAAAAVLGEFDDDRAIEPLVKALGDADVDVRSAVAMALGGLGWEPETDELRVVYLLAKSVQGTVNPDEWGESAVEPLIKALEEDSWGIHGCWPAAVALGEIGDARAIEPLIKALGDDDWGVRQYAAKALGEMGDARAVQPLIKALGSKEESNRRVAARTLGKIGDARAVEPLIKALGDDHQWVRIDAAEALGEIGDERAVEHFIRVLSESDDWRFREAAAEALGMIGDVRAVEPLIKALEDEDDDVRDAAKEALRKLGHEVE